MIVLIKEKETQMTKRRKTYEISTLKAIFYSFLSEDYVYSLDTEELAIFLDCIYNDLGFESIKEFEGAEEQIMDYWAVWQSARDFEFKKIMDECNISENER
jgi:hypothetical protein